MEHDTSERDDRTTSTGAHGHVGDADTETVTGTDTGTGLEIVEELLIEEISIDGMCGVY